MCCVRSIFHSQMLPKTDAVGFSVTQFDLNFSAEARELGG